MATRRRHEDVYMHLRGQILDGRLAPGAGLPKFNELASIYNVSVATINKAIAQLKADGLIRTVKSVGMFVTETSAQNTSKGIIGVVLPETSAYIYQVMMQSISEQSDAEDYTIQLCNSAFDSAKELEHMENLAANPQVKGIIVSPNAGKDANVEYFKWLQGMNYPFVFVDRYLTQIETDSVHCDSVASARKAIEYLLSLGHQRIAFLSAEDAIDQPWCIDRLEGYRQALNSAGIPYDPNLIINNVGASDVENLLQRPNPPTVIFLTSNRYLWQVLEGIESVNREITVAGFDEVEVPIGCLSNDEIHRFINTPIVKVIQPFDKIGQKACELLIGRINGKDTKAINSVFETELIIK